MNTIKLNTIGTPCKAGGNSGGGGGTASSWRYFDFTAYSGNVLEFIESIPSLMHTMRIVVNGKDSVLPMGVLGSFTITDEFLKNIKAVGVDMSALVRNHPLAPNATTMTEVYSTDIGGMTIEQGIKDYSKLSEITEEEFYRMPHNVVLEDGASEDIKIVFEDLMSKISSYPSDEKFDSPLSSYGYDSISFGGNSFTRVGKYSLNVYGGNDIIYLMVSEGDNPEDGWGLYRDNTVSPKEYGLNYPG